MKRLMPQECPLAFLYLTWALYLAGLIYLPIRGEWMLAAAWLLIFPLAFWGYIRIFPRISRFLGYGRVDDVTASGDVTTADDSIGFDDLASAEEVTASSSPPHPGTVTLYTSLGCPFCPIIEERLLALQARMGFALTQVDVTMKPALVRAKKIRSVPVVEVGGRRLVGNATTQELARLVRGGAEGDA